jgi:hypothetical protein
MKRSAVDEIANAVAQKLGTKKYSSTQTIEVSTVPGNYNGALSLDNVASLVQFGTADRNSVQMIISPSPSLTVERPKAGEKYNAGYGPDIEFPAVGKSGIRIGPVTMFHGGVGSAIFDRFNSPTHFVKSGTRRFQITLQSVQDKSTDKRKWIIYTFGISEE